MLERIRTKIRDAIMSSPALYTFLINSRVNNADSLDAYFVPHGEDSRLVMAYQYYLSELLPGVLTLPDALRPMIEGVKSDYDGAMEYLSANPSARGYLGGGWEKHTGEFRTALNGKDYDLIMATLGARNYKNLRLRTGRFNIAHYIQIIATILHIFEGLKSQYNRVHIPYQGYSEFFYPGFRAGGNLFNQSLHDLEMRLFVEDHLRALSVIAEIGAGDGAACRELVASNPNAKYIIFDLPELLIRGQLFLTSYFSGKKRVGGFLDWRRANCSIRNVFDIFDILCLPCWLIEHCDVEVDLWLNTHSLGEMPLEISRKYVEYINYNGKAFISINDNYERKAGHYSHFSADRYLASLSDMTFVKTDFPLSSNFPRINPYYVRHLFARKSAPPP